MYLAEKTLQAINEGLARDQGASYRVWLSRVLPHMKDAYSGDTFPFRPHLGASLLGNTCARQIWYGFRWVKKPKFDGRMIRLFNRGHLEEARFIALLLMIGAEVFQQDENGKQYRISHADGHVGGSGDGVVRGIPDLPQNIPALCEFKTHGEKSFVKLQSEGVEKSKFTHFVQMQLYMHKMGLNYALYMAVNKNTDEIHAEIIQHNPKVAIEFLNRGEKIAFASEAPPRIAETAGWFECRFCDFKDICHNEEKVLENCRTCAYSRMCEKGQWYCTNDHVDICKLSKESQLAGCEHWAKHSAL